MTPNEFGKLIKENIHGVFLFYGEEQYLKQHYINLTKKTISPDGANVMSLSGEGLSLTQICQQIMDMASMPSMDMSSRFLNIYDVEWKKTKEDELDFFEDCMTELSSFEDVVIVFDTRPENFDSGTDKKPSKLLSRINKYIKTVNFAKEPPARLAAWIQKHFAAYKVEADPNVCNFLVKYCGRDMTTLNHEITKLVAYVLQNGKKTVTETDIHTVSSSVNEIDTFDFSNAILNGDTERAFSILTDMKLHKEKPELILGSIASTYSNLYTVKILLEAGMLAPEIIKETGMHEYKAKLYIKRANVLSKKGIEKAIELCHDADIKIKSGSLDSYNILDVLLIKLSMTDRIK